MKSKTLRVIVPIAVGVVAAVAFDAHIELGSPSGIGWGDIALLCPLGALSTMIASKTLVPRALVALLVAVALILVFGRAFCGWICPVPVTRKIPGLFKGKKRKGEPAQAPAESDEALKASVEESVQRNLRGGCGSKGACASCADVKAKIDSRHFVLAGGLLSAAIFGFPVFCLICPIGLSFGTLFLLVALFGSGDLTWSLLAVPLVLVLELVVFRKWCSKICPLSALMSLLGLVNSKTLRPTVDESKCLEKNGAKCGKCHEVCEVSIDPRHPELGAGFNECIKCRACVDACPGHAIEMPLLPKKKE